MNDDLNLYISTYTHNGLKRDNNEDSFSINGKPRPVSKKTMYISGQAPKDSLLLAVYDGMGGEEMGEVASDIAARMSGELLGELNSSTVDDYPKVVDRYTTRANDEICRVLNNNDSRRGGTTMAMAYVDKGVVYPFSLGDSRIYLLVNNELIRISEDHTVAMRKYKLNIYTLEEAEQSTDSHKLTLFLGVDAEGNGLSAQWYQPFIMPRGGVLLICSDGLYDMCSEAEIKEILTSGGDDMTSALVSAALNNGGIDNITCITLENR